LSADPRVLIIGFGNMGRALVRGWLDADMQASAIRVADASPDALAMAREWGLEACDTGAELSFDVLLLAVKPQQVDAALDEHAHLLADDGVVVSIAAGRTIASLQQRLGDDRAIVRSMPNTPAAIARGTTVMCPNHAVTKAGRNACSRLLEAVGVVYWVDDERLFDAVTAVSGSGPAYVFLLIECLAAAGVRHGLPESLATELAMHTVAGAGAYAVRSSTPVAQLRAQVTSPGGTTAAALSVFMRDSALQHLVDEAVAAAAARSGQLSKS